MEILFVIVKQLVMYHTGSAVQSRVALGKANYRIIAFSGIIVSGDVSVLESPDQGSGRRIQLFRRSLFDIIVILLNSPHCLA